MLDFLMVSTRAAAKGTVEIYPKFIISSSSDLMIRGGDFYAVWDEESGMWSTDEQLLIRLVDRELDKYAQEHKTDFTDQRVKVLHMWDADSGSIDRWHKFVQKQSRDRFTPLDEELTFSNTATNKETYASKRLPYPLERMDIPAWDELISVLYSPEERHKIEWAIGSVVCGESKNIQKFIVMYGAAGTGKSTVLNIIQSLFDGYYSVFDAKALGSSSNAFALEAFKANPLVAINHDGDLAHIEDNTRLNSLVSHEYMTVNEKFKSAYSYKFNSFLFMGTNKPVRITEAKSGIIRRLIDVVPTGNKVPPTKYKSLMNKIGFELGGIAWHCMEVYKASPDAYDTYIPVNMIGATNDFYNFVLEEYDIFKADDKVSLKQAWEMYKTYCEDTRVAYPYSMRPFKEELKNYFRNFELRANDEYRTRNLYSGFRSEKFETELPKESAPVETNTIELDAETSLFDIQYADCLAQYANENGTPQRKWSEVTTHLCDIDTSKLHYVLMPLQHIVIDFDIKDESGNKCYALNAEAVSHWPATYSELSQGGQGIHLHYLYSGDTTKLSRIYGDDIEIKVFTGNSSLRRRLTKCNDIPIATINSGLPFKKGGKMVNFDGIKSEKGLVTLIKKNLRKDYHPGTKPSIDFIKTALDDAYESGIKYDVSNMRPAIIAFAAKSTNHSSYCLDMVSKMKFKSEEASENYERYLLDDRLVFFDVEVKPNRFGLVYKMQGKDPVKLRDPLPVDIEMLMHYKLVGFNCRRYDNHMMYARYLGYTNEQIFELSSRVINEKRSDLLFGEAYNLSYTDIYDLSSKKQSLKKWEIELGIHHQEMDSPWDQPADDEEWERIMDYCVNDVLATEALWNSDDIQADWVAREVLADIAGMTVNDTTNTLTTRLIFGKEKKPQLVYTDLATGERSDGSTNPDIIGAFPGYTFEWGDDNKRHNMYRGTDLGFGGYVYAQPGIHSNVALIDVASLHPHSIVNMKYFGEYTKKYEELIQARIFIKHKQYDEAKKMFDGKLSKYLEDKTMAKKLSYALKIALNSCYGLTSATFDNAMRDKRNVNNIVALRGALFMRTLQDEVTDLGFTVVHIKTDSIKIADATPDIIQFCMEFAKKYGYTFEHEATYERICLVNDAVYIAKYASDEWCRDKYGYIPEKNGEHPLGWTATGTQFQVPYVFKKLFSHEPIEFHDKCETKSVTSALYLDMNEGLPDVSDKEKELKKYLDNIKSGKVERDELKIKELESDISKGHNYKFVGKCGQFCPVRNDTGAGWLMRENNGKYANATGASGYRWLESEMVRNLGLEDAIDESYYIRLCDDAVETINKFGDFEMFAG